MKKLFYSVTFLFLAIVLLSGCSASDTVSKMTQSGMIDGLSKDLGMTSSQTEAGLGAMMMLSKDKLSPDDFSKLSKGLPGGTESLINKATNLGVVPGSVSSTADIIQVLTKLGVTPVQAAKFTKSVLSFAGSMGGSTLGLLSKVF